LETLAVYKILSFSCSSEAINVCCHKLCPAYMCAYSRDNVSLWVDAGR